MKVSKFFTLAAISASVVSCNNAADSEAATSSEQEVVEVVEAEVIPVTPASGHVAWVGYKTFVDWSHNGTIQVKEGEFQVKEGEVVGGNFVIDMGSVRPLDLEEGSKHFNDLVGHLASPDFFESATYPTSKFEITSLEKVEGEGTNYVVQGNLTMKDVTNNITFPAQISVAEGMVDFKAPEFSINRTKWNIMFHSSGVEGMMKDDLIDDYIKLSVDLTAQK